VTSRAAAGARVRPLEGRSPASPAARQPALGPCDIGGAALAALREELELHPKPGLVSPAGPGAHLDMDAETFRRSIGALDGFFADAAQAGASGAPFDALRDLGIAAEERMLAATGGINTHRGAIFGLGLIAAAAGRLSSEGRSLAGRAVGLEVSARWGMALLQELPANPASHGSAVARRHGIRGAREEAATGFAHLFDVALPALEASLRAGAGRRGAAVQCLLSLIATLPDTNLLWRGGTDGLAFAQRSAHRWLERGGVERSGWEEELARLHRQFTLRRLSPGGSADLLAAALLVHDLRGAAAWR
jgi:triphosphoribosyl-dephospho-CoA synthase